MDDEDCQCQDSTIAVKTKDNICGARISGVSDVASSQDILQTSETMDVRITTKTNKKYSHKKVFKVKMKSRVQLKGKKYLQGEFRNIITVINTCVKKLYMVSIE